MYAPAASTIAKGPYMNGNLSSLSSKDPTNTAIESDSESGLSEAIDDPATLAPPTNFERPHMTEDRGFGGADDEPSQDEDALGSDDPDYNMETPPHQNAESSQDARSTSQDSPRQRKRKAGVDKDDFIRDDPELYGLRRSVSGQSRSRRRAHLFD